MKNLNKKWELPLFFILTFFVTILCAVIYNLLGWHLFNINNLSFGPGILWFFMIFSPTLSAILLTFIFRGKASTIELLKHYIKFKVKWTWYVAAALLLLVPLIVSLILSLLQIGGGIGLDPELNLILFLAWLVYNFFSGPFAEEGGWRGYALPRLQAKFNSTIASLILGFIWIVWHVPLVLVLGADQAAFTWLSWMIYSILTISITIVLTWLYNNTKGSLVITILAHYFFNLGSNIVVNLFGLVNYTFYSIIGGVAGVIYLGIIFIRFGYKRFSKLPESELPIITS